jgi:hypothetical protein
MAGEPQWPASSGARVEEIGRVMEIGDTWVGVQNRKLVLAIA